jgi:hypothetical protein
LHHYVVGVRDQSGRIECITRRYDFWTLGAWVIFAIFVVIIILFDRGGRRDWEGVGAGGYDTISWGGRETPESFHVQSAIATESNEIIVVGYVDFCDRRCCIG